jgi:hypothetical protein
VKETQPASGIPPILHQMWSDATVPSRFAGYQQSWQAEHPGWRYCLWTDEDNRELLRRHYPWFLPIYDNYPQGIMRSDAARYFILHHHGGVYADLDAECVRPLDPLLAGRELVLVEEPAAHLKQHRERGYPLDRIVSNAFMASAPGHPFWEHVHKLLVGYHRAPGALDATGPFLVTRAVTSYEGPDTVTVLPAEPVFPLTSEAPWHTLPPGRQEDIRRTAFVLHHWAGTWWRPDAARQAREARFTLLVQGSAAGTGALRLDSGVDLLRHAPEAPLVSCLMITRDRPALARRAVRCFREQTYASRELVIVDDGEDGTLQGWVAGLGDPRVHFFRLPAQGKTLGWLRNLAVDLARGSHVAQWDDDDLSSPQRLEVMMAALAVCQADTCVLERQLVWWPGSRRLAVSARRTWEGSFVCARDRLPRYPELRRGEDTPVIDRLVATGRAVVLDHPALYCYVFHGGNTFEAEHWEQHWRAATERFEGGLYEAMLGELRQRFSIEPCPVADPGAPEPEP